MFKFSVWTVSSLFPLMSFTPADSVEVLMYKCDIETNILFYVHSYTLNMKSLHAGVFRNVEILS